MNLGFRYMTNRAVRLCSDPPIFLEEISGKGRRRREISILAYQGYEKYCFYIDGRVGFVNNPEGRGFDSANPSPYFLRGESGVAPYGAAPLSFSGPQPMGTLADAPSESEVPREKQNGPALELSLAAPGRPVPHKN
jgi:hypothetical protein